MLKKYEVDTVYTTDRKISQFLKNPKDKIPLEEQGVYEILCGSCDRAYIGQSNRKIGARRKEHKNAIARRQLILAVGTHITHGPHQFRRNKNQSDYRTFSSKNYQRSNINREKTRQFEQKGWRTEIAKYMQNYFQWSILSYPRPAPKCLQALLFTIFGTARLTPREMYYFQRLQLSPNDSQPE